MSVPLLRNGGAVPEGSLPRLPEAAFRRAILEGVAAGRRLALLFGVARPEGGARLYALLAHDASGGLEPLSCDASGRYEALTPDCPQAHYFEREIHEQTGVVPEGHPWLKPVRRHDAAHPFHRIDGEEIHEVAVGPVHAGIIDPGHFRLQCFGETVHHLEIRLGYQHRGVEEALSGAPGGRAALLAECVAGDTTIGHVLAWCRAIEALCGRTAPPRAEAIRAIALELERLANHAGDLGALGADIGFLPAQAWFGALRGDLLGLMMDLTGSRFGRGLVRPGGVLFDLPARLADDLRDRLGRTEASLRGVARLFFETPSVRSRLEGAGVLARRASDELGLLGPAARACGSPRDVRRDHPTGHYRVSAPEISLASTGDALARARVRWLEIERSLAFLEVAIRSLPAGAIMDGTGPAGPPTVPIATKPGLLAVAMEEGWRGEIVHAAITDAGGRILKHKIKDPSFQNWTGLALALRGVPISDFPLCNKSFNLSYAGHDL